MTGELTHAIVQFCYVLIAVPSLLILIGTRVKFSLPRIQRLALLTAILVIYVIFEAISNLLNATGKNGYLTQAGGEIILAALLPVIPMLTASLFRIRRSLAPLNRALTVLGTATFAAILIFSISIPELFLSRTGTGVTGSVYGISSFQQFGPIFIWRNVFLLLYSGYFFINAMFQDLRKTFAPIKTSLYSAFIVLILAGLVELLFQRFPGLVPGPLSLLSYVNTSLGIALFALILSVGLIRRVFSLAGAAYKLQGELSRKQEELEKREFVDARSKLPNEKAFYRDLDKALTELPLLEPCELGILMFTLTNYSELTEAFGGDVSRLFLEQIIHRVRSVTTHENHLYALNENEFIIMIPDAHSPERLTTLARILQSVISRSVSIGDDSYFSYSSIAVVSAPGDGGSQHELMKNLTSCMNSSKIRNNSIQIFSSGIREANERRIHILHLVKENIRTGGFYFHYQPIVDRDRRIVSLEALLRWDEDFGPEEFIPHVESSGMMYELAPVLLKNLINDCRKIKALGAHIPVSLNLSPIQFLDDAFTRLLISDLDASGLTGDIISFEITENAFLTFTDQTLNQLRLFRENGYRIALDDFGKGYSSLSYLMKMPVDSIKLDRAFIQDMERDPEKVAIARSIIAMVRDIGPKLIIEGVETEDQLSMLIEMGAEEFQGYLFRRPLLLDELLELYQ